MKKKTANRKEILQPTTTKLVVLKSQRTNKIKKLDLAELRKKYESLKNDYYEEEASESA